MAPVEIQATAAALLAEQGALAALILLPDDGTACCRVGYDVLPLPAGEAVPAELVPLGAVDGVPVVAAWDVAVERVARVVLARDPATGALAAVLL
jgi:hypothetical protein